MLNCQNLCCGRRYPFLEHNDELQRFGTPILNDIWAWAAAKWSCDDGLLRETSVRCRDVPHRRSNVASDHADTAEERLHWILPNVRVERPRCAVALENFVEAVQHHQAWLQDLQQALSHIAICEDECRTE